MTFIVNLENGINTCSVKVTNLSPFPVTESQQIWLTMPSSFIAWCIKWVSLEEGAFSWKKIKF